MKRKIINIGIVSVIIFLSLFFSITLLFLKSFEFKPAKQHEQYSGNNISENHPAIMKSSLFRNIVIAVGIILLGIFSSYRLMLDPCDRDKDTDNVSAWPPWI